MSIVQRRAKERNERIEKIQKAARKVFWKKGYHNTSVEDIARKVSVSKGTVYFYFRSKDELYVSLMIPLIEQLNFLLKEFEKNVQEGQYRNGEEFIRGIVDLLIELHKFDPHALNIFQIFQLESLFSSMSEPTRDILRKIGHANFTLLQRIITQGIELGYLLPLDPVQLADMLWGSFLGIVQLEQAKFLISKKNHLLETLTFTFSSFCTGILKK
ncbi:MAG: TetR/AcrR family transcriptional regulator [Desulfobacteraceae bacterium]|nr:MAG: TetR/AcrR family transcriptional regulator [Desulfobacteraceae bacterium]